MHSERIRAALAALAAQRERLTELVRQLPAHGVSSHSPERLAACWAQRAASLDAQTAPLVSVIVPVYNHLDATLRCLQSIADVWFGSLPVEVIVVDDGSTDRTAGVLAAIPGIAYLRREENGGFIAACNSGAQVARGTYLYFLNNDTVVCEGWLERLVATAQSDVLIGAVGSKLVWPDGRLQEAGSIVWRDGTAWNYGREGHPDDPRYNYRREVDYCSGASLLVKRDLFELLGGFDTRYAPAYYEETDLCFGLRSLGYRVVYEPTSRVIHFEGVTAGRDPDAGVKRFQEINRAKFCEKWSAVLPRHFENDPRHVHRAALARNGGETILVVDSYVPLHDRESGSHRLMELLKIMRRARYNVIFLPDNYADMQPYCAQLQAMGIEVLHHTENGPALMEALLAVVPSLDGAWICRTELLERYAPVVRKNGAARIWFDTVDLGFIREKRRAELFGEDSSAWRDLEQKELAAAQLADVTITVTEAERSVLLSKGVSQVQVVPNVHEQPAQRSRYGSSKGLLFIGGYRHAPNVDAAKWLCEEIMPHVWSELPDLTLTLLGDAPPPEVCELACERVRVPGYVADVEPYFLGSNVFVAPLRYGAGMKGKVGHAMAYGLPSVLTNVAIEGFDVSHEHDCLIANDASSIAQAIVRLYRDKLLWARVSRHARAALKPFTPRAVQPMLLSALRQALDARNSTDAATA